MLSIAYLPCLIDNFYATYRRDKACLVSVLPIVVSVLPIVVSVLPIVVSVLPIVVSVQYNDYP
jgi:hypothetical protein